MEIIRGLHNLRPRHWGCVASIGNFDGVHLGHQAVFRTLRERAKALGLPSVIIIFEPQPLEYFSPASAPPRLTRLREKLHGLAQAGIDRVLILEFGPRLAEMPAPEFVDRCLVRGLSVRFLLVGDDFRFGRARGGDFSLLQAEGRRHGYEVASIDTFRLGEERVSSTWIREVLQRGDLQTAAQCLGRPYAICGRVAHGDKRGRGLGFPTANLDLHRRASPLHGVYAVRVQGLEHQPHHGVANLGHRPTIQGERRFLLEVHLFGLAREIYGAHLQVEFLHKLRDERRFASLDELRRQIHLDVLAARRCLGLSEDAGPVTAIPGAGQNQ